MSQVSASMPSTPWGGVKKSSRRRRFSVLQKDALFRQFNEWGFDAKGWSPVTRNRYQHRVRAADQWLVANRNTSIIHASTKDIKAYLFSTSPSARNRNNIRQGLVGWGEFAVEEGIWQHNRALELPRLPEPVSLPKAFDPQQAHKIEVACKQFGPMIEAMILVMLYAGLRKTEARTLKWREVEDGWLRFQGKRGKWRAVPMAAPLEKAMKRWKTKSLEVEWVFPSPRKEGSPISERHFHYLVNQVGELAGVPLHPHLLRHTAATRLLETGADMRTCQEFLGHADPKTTSIYLRVRPPKLKEAVARMTYDDVD